MATIENENENYLAYRIGIDNNVNNNIWIGLTDIKLEGNWHWLKYNYNLSYIDYTNWNDEYKPGNHDCASIVIKSNLNSSSSSNIAIESKWNDVSCENQFSFICDSITTTAPTSIPTVFPPTRQPVGMCI